ncbi:hypothetical protein Tco_1380190 [Tanacetum coccineum]
MTPVKERYVEYKFEDDDIEDGDDYNNKVHAPHYLFKVEARIEHMMVLLTWKSLILGSISWRFTSHCTDLVAAISWFLQVKTYESCFSLVEFSIKNKRRRCELESIHWTITSGILPDRVSRPLDAVA